MIICIPEIDLKVYEEANRRLGGFLIQRNANGYEDVGHPNGAWIHLSLLWMNKVRNFAIDVVQYDHMKATSYYDDWVEHIVRRMYQDIFDECFKADKEEV